MRILHFEDAEWIVKLYRNLFEDVTSAGHRNQIELFLDPDKVKEFDLIICDYNLYGIKGTEIVERIRKFSNIPILANGSMRSDSQEMIEAGATSFLDKNAGSDYLDQLEEKRREPLKTLEKLENF